MMHLVLVFVLTAAIFVESDACPTMCTCNHHDISTINNQIIYQTVKCNQYSTNLTENLDETTHHLIVNNLNGSELELLIGQLLSEEIRFPYLVELTIINSLITEFINFDNFTRIHTIHFVSDKFDNLTTTLLNLSYLQNLDLINGNLIEIDNQPFRTLDELETLNLSGNSLITINSDSFSGLFNLKCLDLSNNNLTKINQELLEKLTLLQYLNLSNNNLSILNERLFKNLLKLQQLDVSNNRLKQIELGSFQLPSLARLLLSNNHNLGESNEPTIILVGNGQRLQIVDASNIGLKQVPGVLTHSIRTLRLTKNSIKIINCGDFDSYPLLQLLDLKSNRLEIIEDDALGRLDSLNVLYLTDNKLKEIPKSLPETLKVLHLEQNEIENVANHDLQDLPVLEVLLLNDNKINMIENGAFKQLTNLITLDLSRNPIKILTTDCLSGPIRLQVLRLSDIGVIQPVKEVSFPLSTIEHLIILDLSKSFGLARQLLADTAALAASRELQELDLSFTNLENIRSDLLHYLPQLRLFRLDGNRFDCSQLQWLGIWMRRQNNDEYRKIICFKPTELSGSLLIDLQDDNQSNFDMITTKPATTTIIDNDDIQLPLKYDKLDELSPKAVPVTLDDGSGGGVNSNSSHEYHPQQQQQQQWNISSSTGEMSMFSMDGDRNKIGMPHPGMLILIGGILGAVLILTILTRKLTRKHWDNNTTIRLRDYDNNDFVEINDLPGVTELW